MKRGTRALLLAGIPLVLIGLSMVAMLMDGSVNRSERDLSEIGLPASATRVLYYEDGFADWAIWIAFSGTQPDVDAYLVAQCGKSLVELDEWKVGMPDEIAVPSRPAKLNNGNWDVDAVREGKVFSSFDGHYGIDILVDTIRWRVFLCKYTT